MKRIFTVILTLAMAVTLFAGCGNKQGSSTKAPEASSAAQKDQTFIFSRSATITNFDPQKPVTGQQTMLQYLYYDSLVSTNTKDGKPVGKLATSWDMAKDGLSWTFKLRQGVKFHNGYDFNADDVVASFHRLLTDPVSATAKKDYTSLSSVEKVDDYTVKLILSKPIGALLNNLTTFSIFSAKVYKELGENAFVFNDKYKPIGTGAFKCTSYTAGGDVVFTRNDDWWGLKTGTGSNCKTIIYRPLTEEATRLAGAQTGQLDFIDNITSDSVDKLTAVKNLKVDRLPSSAGVYLGFMCDQGIFQDKNARLAAVYAIDRDLLASAIAGGGRGATWPVTKQTQGFSDEVIIPKQDLAKAKEYLAKSSYKGEPVTLLASNGLFARSNEIYQSVASMLTEAGFKVNLQVLDNATVTTMRTQKKYDMICTNNIMGNDAEFFLRTRWLNDPFSQGYKNDEMMGLIRNAGSESDPAKRMEMLQKAMKLSAQEAAPVTLLYEVESIICYKNGITGFEDHDSSNYFDFSRVQKNV